MADSEARLKGDFAPAPPGLVRASPLARAVRLFGDRWSLLILRSVGLGAGRYSEIRAVLEGVSDAVLSARLKYLCEQALLERDLSAPGNHEYRLTERSLDAVTIGLAVWVWEKEWVPSASGRSLRHLSCRKECRPYVQCGHCRKKLHWTETHAVAGPGAQFEKVPKGVARRMSHAAVNDHDAGRLFAGESVELLGDWWSMMIVVTIMQGRYRFSELHAVLGTPSQVLSDRLRRLVDLEILEPRLYQDHPVRYEYVLTAKGDALYPVMSLLSDWGARWLSDPEGPPTVVLHVPCGSQTDPMLVCDRCGAEVGATTAKLG